MHAMYQYDEIRRVHLELTTRCNAACPQCPRNIFGGRVNPGLPITELSLGQVERIFVPEFLRQLIHVTICGNYGDAINARDLLDICRYFRVHNPWIDIELHTNGSARTKKFWMELAHAVTRCIFAIDGLEDTNHLYRRNTRWEKIIENVRTFIRSGGTAEWNFIVFRHNEHQVELAAAYARELGFARFYVKRTGRFSHRGKVADLVQILDSRGRTVGTLQPPANPKFRNPAAEALKSVTRGTTYEALMSETPVHCSAAELKGIYISAEGLVFPCCWMGQIFSPGRPSRRKMQILKMVDQFGGDKSAINAQVRTIEAIIGSEIFQTAIPAGWGRGSDRLEVCARQCGKFRLSGTQKTPSLI
jgi:MoaA/NifB/PqqE/SkfB family radical SAM enzyme